MKNNIDKESQALYTELRLVEFQFKLQSARACCRVSRAALAHNFDKLKFFTTSGEVDVLLKYCPTCGVRILL